MAIYRFEQPAFFSFSGHSSDSVSIARLIRAKSESYCAILSHVVGARCGSHVVGFAGGPAFGGCLPLARVGAGHTGREGREGGRSLN